jgi:hypothetical protein
MDLYAALDREHLGHWLIAAVFALVVLVLFRLRFRLF